MSAHEHDNKDREPELIDLGASGPDLEDDVDDVDELAGEAASAERAGEVVDGPWPGRDRHDPTAGDVVFEGGGVEWVDDDLAAGSVPYDYEIEQGPPRLFADSADRSEVLPDWARSRAVLKATLGRRSAHVWFLLRFHTVHLPLVVWRLVVWSPRGLGRAAKAVCWWLADVSSAEALSALTFQVAAGGSGSAHLVSERRAHRATVRQHLVVGLLAVLAGAVGVWWLSSRPWLGWLAVGAVVAGLGLGGRPDGKRWLDRAVSVDRPVGLDWGLIEDALRGLEIAGLNKAFADADKTGRPVAVHKVTPVRETPTGWSVELDLPRGVTVSQIADRRPKLASGLRRPVSCVFVSASTSDDAHEGRAALFVTARPMRQMKPRAWPLLKSGRASVFGPVPIGVDARGRAVEETLFEQSVLIGAIPGVGKTRSALQLVLGLALDPATELHVHDLKGMGDWAAVEPVCHRYNGDAGNADSIAVLRADLEAVQADMTRRAGVIGRLVADSMKTGPARPRRLTPGDVADRGLDLVPVVVLIDECQVAFGHPEHGKAIAGLVEDIVRRGRALGVIVVLATQKPSSEAVPTDVRDQISLRFCLCVKTAAATNMVLGDGWSTAGFRPHEVLSRADKGIGYWLGADGDPLLVRFDYVEDEQPVMARALAERRRLGWLTGQAAGEETADVRSGLDDLAEAWPVSADRAHLDTMAGWLSARWPDRYRGWDARTTGAMLRRHDLEPRAIRVGETVTSGLERSEVLDALARRGTEDGGER